MYRELSASMTRTFLEASASINDAAIKK